VPGGVGGALAALARARPEAPFLFCRNARGQFRWWSYSTAFTFVGRGRPGAGELSAKGIVVEPEAVELLDGFLRAAIGEDSDSTEAAQIPDPEPRAPRDVWISWRSLTDPAEAAIARWAIVSGAAILVEPGPALHPELFAWARPTVLSGEAEELFLLADRVEALAPRFLRRRWLRQRGARLRLVLVAGTSAPETLRQLGERWRYLLPEFTPRIEPVVVQRR
jgi:hypothetical protein